MVAIRDLTNTGWRSNFTALKSDKKKLRFWLMGGGVAVVALVGFVMWMLGGRYVSTNDAYVQANKLMVSSDVSGIVSEVDVHEGQAVKAGQVLFRLDPQPFQIALDTAQSALAQTVLDIQSMKHDYQRLLSDAAARKAEADLAQVNYRRQALLMERQATARATLDQARATMAAANGDYVALQQQASVQLSKLGGSLNAPVERHPQYLQALSRVAEAKRKLEHTVVRAPFDGMVTQVASLQKGAMIISSMAAFMPTSAVGLVSTSNVWIQANVKETDLTWVKNGDPVSISIDTYSGREYHGSVFAIAPGTGSTFSVLPSENTSGNWVKVVQRVPVRIVFDKDDDISNLRAGMSTTVKIDTGHRRSLSELF